MSRPTIQPRPAEQVPSTTSNPPPVRYTRSTAWLSITAGVLFLVAQTVMWTFDQQLNLDTAQDPLFISAKIIYLAGFIVLMFALLTAYRSHAPRAGRLGTAAVSVAIVGTMLLAGDLWFESFAVPWLAGAPGGSGLTSQPSTIMGLGAIASYSLFAAGWTFFGIASLRARVFPVLVSVALIVGGIAGFRALLAPYGIPLGLAVAALGVWILIAGPRPRETIARLV